jgi:hypothetical protein
MKCYGNFGSGTLGPKVRVMYAAHLLDDPMMKAMVAGTADMDVIKAGNAPAPDSTGSRSDRVVEHFTSDGEIFTGLDGIPYYGARFQSYCLGGPSVIPQLIGTVARNPNMIGDSKCDCISGTTYQNYIGINANHMPYWRVVVKSLGLEALFNNDPLLEFAYGWKEGNRGPARQGQAHVEGLYCQNKDPWMTHTSHTQRMGGNIWYRTAFGEEMWDKFKDYIATPDVLSLYATADNVSGTCSPSFVADVTGVTGGSCDTGNNVDWYLRCPGTAAPNWEVDYGPKADNADTTHDFTKDCTITSANESEDIVVRVDCPPAPGVTSTQTVNIDVSCTTAVNPEITRLDLVECVDPPSIVKEITLAGPNTIDKSNIGSCYAICATVDTETESIAWDYDPPSGDPATTPYNENSEPFCLNGENSWWDFPGGIPSCVCSATSRGDLSEVGVHTLSVIPYELDNQVNAGTTFGPLTFTVSDGSPPTTYDCSAQ